MKVLLDVIKTLLLINGAVVLPSFFLVMAVSERHSTNMSTADNVSSKFHRNIEDDTPAYKRQLEQLAVEKNQLQAKLEASQQTQAVRPVLDNPAPAENRPTQVNPVVSSQTVTAQSKPTVQPSARVKTTMVSQTQLPSKPSQSSVPKTSVSPPRETEMATVKQKSFSKRVSEVNVAVNASTTHRGATGDESTEQEVGTAIPKGFISVDDLNKKDKNQTESYSIVASQGKSPMDLSKDLAAGLIVAGNRDELSHKSTTYRKVQTAISSLRKGSSQTLEEAARRAGIDLDTLQWVAYYGQNRPGGIQISRANLR